MWNYLENHDSCSSESKAFCDYMMYFLQALHVSLYFHVEYKCLSLSSAWNTNEKCRSGFLLLYFSFWWNVIYKWGLFFQEILIGLDFSVISTSTVWCQQPTNGNCIGCKARSVSSFYYQDSIRPLKVAVVLLLRCSIYKSHK